MQALARRQGACAAATTTPASSGGSSRPALALCCPRGRLARPLCSRMACAAALSSSRSRPWGLGTAPRRLLRPVCAGTGTEEASSSTTTAAAAAAPTEERLKATLADLDALLGIEEEPAPGEDNMASSAAAAAADLEVLQSAVSAELQKLAAANNGGSGAAGAADKGAATELERDMSDQMRKIVERAKRMTEDDDADRLTQKAALQQEFEQLLNIFFTGEAGVDKADVKRLKESGVFGALTFWVTEIRSLEEMGAPPGAASGVLIRGNLRTDRRKVFAALVDKARELFGDKYAVLMVEDPEAALEGGGDELGASSSSSGSGSGGSGQGGSSGGQGGGGASARAAAAAEPRVAFQLLPLADVTPPPTTGWKVAVAGILLLLLVACSVQLSLVANISKLPRETLEYFANPDSGALNPDSSLPPGLADWDPVPYLSSAIPIAVSLVGVNFAHELGHRVAALVRRVKLGPTFFIPNLQIGSFGGITPLQSLVKDRGALWDVAAAGPLAGALASGALLAVGLSQSHDGGLPPELMVPVPTQLFQGSLLLGAVTRLALGADALSRADVSVSPLVIAGWCGLVTNALNLLPVGCLDGGRMMQSAFGMQALSLSAFFTYVGLGLGLLGSSLSLPFGLYVLICQRTAERYIQDSVSPVADAKRTATAVAVLTAVLVLLPMADEVASSVGIGAGGPIVF